jgi:hypothetical protein
MDRTKRTAFVHSARSVSDGVVPNHLAQLRELFRYGKATAFAGSAFSVIVTPHLKTSMDLRHWSNPEEFDPDRYKERRVGGDHGPTVDVVHWRRHWRRGYGVQVASIFNSFDSQIRLFEAGPRILATEDEDAAAAVRTALRKSGIVVRENFGAIESFEKTPAGVRMNFSKNGQRESAEATLAVVAVGGMADTSGLNLAAAGVETDDRGS